MDPGGACLMGWKLNAIAFLFALWSLGNGALIIGVPILLYLSYRFWANRQAKSKGTGRSRWMIYLGIFFIVLAIIAMAEQGAHSPFVFGVTGCTLLALALFPGSIRDFVGEVSGPFSELFGLMSGKGKETDTSTCVELTQVPLDYIDSQSHIAKEKPLRFQRLAQILVETGERVQLRLEFGEGRGRVIFRLLGKNANERTPSLLQLIRSQLPEFRPEIANFREMDCYAVPIEGIPENSINPVDPLARYFLENRLQGGYSVTIYPGWVDRLTKWLAGRRQRRLAEGSEFQRRDNEKTVQVIDHPKQIELAASMKMLDRLLARRPAKVSVEVWAKQEATAIQAANILAGALSSHDRFTGLKILRVRAPGKSPWNRFTLMLPSEAGPYFWLPQMSLGMKISLSAEFQTPQPCDGGVVLGEVISLSGKTGHLVRVESDQLVKHVFVTGMTGSGKTTSCFSLLLQLNAIHIPFLVIEPVKSEYRSLVKAVPGLQIFTIGAETAPFRLNIFEPPPGVSVETHLDSVEAAWNSSFTMYAPLPYVIKKVLVETYQSCGWNIRNNTLGRPIMLADFRRAAESVARSLGYEPNVTMNIESAMKVRIGNLELGKEGDVFNTAGSTPLESILSHPTVIELKDISHPEEKAFVAALLLSNLTEYLEVKGHSKSLKHLTVIEEAHRLLPNISTAKTDPEGADSRKVMVERFGNMLAEVRAYGEGLVVVEQIPTKILPDAIKNTATKIAHRIPAADDREVLAGAMGLSTDQALGLTALTPGEAIVHIQNHPLPIMAAIPDKLTEVGISVGEVNDECVRSQMTGYYLKYPASNIPTSALRDRLLKIVDNEWFRLKFKEGYDDVLTSRTPDKLLDLVTNTALANASGEGEFNEMVRNLLQMGTEFYLPLNEKDRERFPREVMAYLARVEKDGRRG